MDSRKRSRLYDADTASVALLEASDDDSTDSEEEPCMQNDETDSSFLLSDYDERTFCQIQIQKAQLVTQILIKHPLAQVLLLLLLLGLHKEVLEADFLSLVTLV